MVQYWCFSERSWLHRRLDPDYRFYFQKTSVGTSRDFWEAYPSAFLFQFDFFFNSKFHFDVGAAGQRKNETNANTKMVERQTISPEKKEDCSNHSTGKK